MSEFSTASVVRIAKKAGVDRVGEDAAVLLIEAVEEYIADITSQAYEVSKSDGRKTLKAVDFESFLY